MAAVTKETYVLNSQGNHPFETAQLKQQEELIDSLSRCLTNFEYGSTKINDIRREVMFVTEVIKTGKSTAVEILLNQNERTSKVYAKVIKGINREINDACESLNSSTLHVFETDSNAFESLLRELQKENLKVFLHTLTDPLSIELSPEEVLTIEENEKMMLSLKRKQLDFKEWYEECKKLGQIKPQLKEDFKKAYLPLKQEMAMFYRKALAQEERDQEKTRPSKPTSDENFLAQIAQLVRQFPQQYEHTSKVVHLIDSQETKMEDVFSEISAMTTDVSATVTESLDSGASSNPCGPIVSSMRLPPLNIRTKKG